MLYRNPNVFVVAINSKVFLAVNPLIKKGSQIINLIQRNVLECIDGGKSIDDITKELNLTKENFQKIINILQKKKMIAGGSLFPKPQRNGNPQRMSFWIHTTNQCTLRCSYCHVHKENTSMTQEVLKAFGEKLKQTAREQRLKKASLNVAGGEPMMMFNLFKNYLPQLMEELKELGCELRIGFTTNLTILNQEIINFLKKYKCSLAVSMDGLKAFHDQTRFYPDGSGSFEVIEKNLDLLQKNGIKPMIITVVSNQNLDGLLDFTRYMTERGLRLRYSMVRGDNLCDGRKLVAKILECYSLIEEYIKKENGYNFLKQHSLSALSFSNPASQYCGTGRRSASIFVDGSIHICHSVHSLNQPIGNVFTSEEDLLTLVMNQTVKGDINEIDCDDCQYRYICSGGCPMERTNGKSPYCEVYQKLIPRVYQLIGLERWLKLKRKLEK